MPIPALPTPYVRSKSYEIDDEATFTSPLLVTYNATTHKWTAGLVSFHDDQADDLATAIEKLYQQDFDGTLEVSAMQVDEVLDVDGVTVLSQAIAISITQTSNALTGFSVGGQGMTPGLAWSLRSMIRNELGIGTPYVP